MTLFTIHTPPAEDKRDGSLGVRLAAHKFSWAAFSFGPLWLLYHRLWLAATLTILANLALAAAVGFGHLSPVAAYMTLLAIAFLIGVDGREWLRRRMAQRGLALRGVCVAGDETQAFAKAFAQIQKQSQVQAPPPPPAASAPIQRALPLGSGEVAL